MRPHEIFAAMSQEQAQAVFGRLQEQAPAMFQQAVYAAAAALKSRPQFLMKQPLSKRTAAVRRALSRVAAGPIAEELLAVYFLECRKEVLIEWLDRIGLEHDEGALEQARPPQPAEADLAEHVEGYLSAGDDPDRLLLLRAFGAQSSVDWPALDALVRDRK